MVGRKFNDHRAVEDEWPKVKRICLRGLTPAEPRQRDRHRAWPSSAARSCCARSTGRPRGSTRWSAGTSRPPCRRWTTRPTARCSAAALGTIGLVEPPDARLLWIANTLDLAEVECSAAYLDEARRRADLEILTGPRELPFDDAGNLPD